MGQNFYAASSVRAGLDKKCPSYNEAIFNERNPEANYSFESFTDRREKIWRRVYTGYCREFLAANFTGITYKKIMEEDNDRPGFIGILCMGDTHSDVSYYLMEKEDRISLLQKAFYSIFKARVDILAEKYTEEKHGGFNLDLPVVTIFSDHIIRKRDAVLTLFIPSWKNRGKKIEPSFVSLLLAILREVRIVSKMVEGFITTRDELFVEFMSIGYDRIHEKDETHFDTLCLEEDDDDCSTYYLEGMSSKRAMESIKGFLLEDFNPMGSDYASMIFTGFYALGHGLVKNLFEANVGPVSSILGASEEHLSKISRYISRNISLEKEVLDVVNSVLIRNKISWPVLDYLRIRHEKI